MVEGRVKNKGQARMYEVENSHSPIIDRDTYDKVQAEIKRRTDLAADGKRAGGKIKCTCGDMFRWFAHYYKGEKTPLWICKTKQLSKNQKCKQPHIKETEIENAFVSALNKLIGDKEKFITDFMETANQIITDKDHADYEIKTAELNAARDEMLELDRAKAKHKID